MGSDKKLRNVRQLKRRKFLGTIGTGFVGGSLLSSLGRVRAQSPESGDWPLGRNDPANSSNNPNSNPPTNVLPLVDGYNIHKKWEFNTKNSIYSTPLIVDDTVFVTAGTKLHALEADSGNELWYSDLDSSVPWTPAVSNGSIIVGNENEKLFSLHTSNGDIQWETSLDNKADPSATTYSLSAPPIVSGDTVYATAGKLVYAINVNSGEEKWRFNTNGYMRASPAVAEDPRLAPRTLVIRSHQLDDQGDNILAINAESGELLWKYETENRTSAPPVIHESRVILNWNSEGNSQLYSLQLRNGELAGEFKTEKNWLSVPAVSEKGVIVATHADPDSKNDSVVYNISMNDIRWETGVDDFRQPRIIGDTVIGAHGSMLNAINIENGKKLWDVDLFTRYNDVNLGSAVCVDGIIFGRNTAGTVYALESRNVPSELIAGTVGLGAVGVLWRKLRS